MRSRKQKRPGAVIKKIDQLARSADISPERANRLGESAYLDVHAAMHVEMVHGAASVAAEYAGGVGVVNHHDRAILVGEIAKCGQRANVSVHGENAVGDDEFVPGLSGNRRQLLFLM